MSRLCNWWRRRFLHRRQCPECGEWAAKWTKVPILFEDEPPMLVRYICTECGWVSDIGPTVLTHNAVVGLGYKDSCEYFEKAIEPKLSSGRRPERRPER
jgi:hypothetical protein